MDDRWIGCKDELPEPNVDVYVFCESEREIGVHIAKKLDGTNHFVGSDERRYENVTHWSPLPEPPPIDDLCTVHRNNMTKNIDCKKFTVKDVINIM